MYKSILKYILIAWVFVFASCETYPDWKEYVKYSSVFPVCGEFLIKEYDPVVDTVISDEYSQFYIYNKSYNPTGDSIWLDNWTGHPTNQVYPFRFKIKTKADTLNYTFNANMCGLVMGSNPNPKMDTVRVSITNSKIFRLAKDITDPTPDSIYFIFTIYQPDLTTIFASRIVKGHRKTGWEMPNESDNM